MMTFEMDSNIDMDIDILHHMLLLLSTAKNETPNEQLANQKTIEQMYSVLADILVKDNMLCLDETVMDAFKRHGILLLVFHEPDEKGQEFKYYGQLILADALDVQYGFDLTYFSKGDTDPSHAQECFCMRRPAEDIEGYEEGEITPNSKYDFQ